MFRKVLGAALAVVAGVCLVAVSLADTITVKQNGTSRNLTFLVVDSTSHVTGVTGLTTGGTTATVGTGTSTTTSVLTTAPPVVGSELIGATGTAGNVGQKTIVQSFTGSSNPYTVTVAPALAVAPAAADTFTASLLVVQVSKNGGAFGSPSGTLSEIGNGLYALMPSTTDTGTLGSLVIHASATGADPADREFNVVAYNSDDNVYLGLNSLSALVPTVAAVSDGSSTTTVIDSNLNVAPDLSGDTIVFTSGADKGCYRQITGHNTANGQLTLGAALPSAPTNGSAFYVLGGSKQLSNFLAALGTDNRVEISANTHSSGVSIAGISGTTLPTAIPAFPTNFSSLAISGGGAVTAGTVADKSGYSLASSQSFSTSGSVGSISGITFPGSFGLLGIDGSGKVALQSGEHTAIGADIWSALTSSYNAMGTFGHAVQSLSGGSDTPGTTTLLSRIPSALAITSGGVTVAGYASGQDPATLLLSATVDGGLTLRQLQALSAAVLAGSYTISRDTVAKTITVTYYRPTSPSSTTTVLAVLITNYSDTALTQPTGRSATYSNLP